MSSRKFLNCFLLILTMQAWPARASGSFTLDCISEGQVYHHCAATQPGGNIEIAPDFKKKLRFDKRELAGLQIGSQCYWISRSFRVRRTHCFDNGPDYFAGGLARYLDADGKFGFMDEKLDIVISARFDFAFPFANGKAEFCNGCVIQKSKEQEHSWPTGGTWGYINRKGQTTSDDSHPGQNPAR